MHDPQCVGFVVVSTQEKLQSVGAVGAQTTPQAWDAPAVTQIGAGSLQIVPQRPQSVAEDRSDSQPSAAIALQWVNPVTHTVPHAVPSHVGAWWGPTGQGAHDAPHVSTSASLTQLAPQR